MRGRTPSFSRAWATARTWGAVTRRRWPVGCAGEAVLHQGVAQLAAGDDADAAVGAQVVDELFAAEEDERLDVGDEVFVADLLLEARLEDPRLAVGEPVRRVDPDLAPSPVGRLPVPVGAVAGHAAGVAFELDEVEGAVAHHEHVHLEEAAGAGVEELEEGPGVVGGAVGQGLLDELDAVLLVGVWGLSHRREARRSERHQVSVSAATQRAASGLASGETRAE